MVVKDHSMKMRKKKKVLKVIQLLMNTQEQRHRLELMLNKQLCRNRLRLKELIKIEKRRKKREELNKKKKKIEWEKINHELSKNKLWDNKWNKKNNKWCNNNKKKCKDNKKRWCCNKEMLNLSVKVKKNNKKKKIVELWCNKMMHPEALKDVVEL